MNLRRISSLIALFTIAILMGLGQTQRQTSTPTLRVDQPETYLELGEQLAALARNQQQIGHASQVLAMGVLLAQRANNLQLAASCCIALRTLQQRRVTAHLVRPQEDGPDVALIVRVHEDRPRRVVVRSPPGLLNIGKVGARVAAGPGPVSRPGETEGEEAPVWTVVVVFGV